jgi:hypothetical protein
MKIHKGDLVYSSAGKQIFLRLGTILQKGSFIKSGDNFVLLEENYRVFPGDSDFTDDISHRREMINFLLKKN